MVQTEKKQLTGSVAGLILVIAIGFAFYFLLTLTRGMGSIFTYSDVVTGITARVDKQLLWFLMNFTEPQFYASCFAGGLMILGGFVAWYLARKNSRLSGMDICYGSSNLFPWVLLSQILSAGLAIFVYRYIDLFDVNQTTWVATFISIVGAPPSVVLIYGPSIPALLTSSILAGLISVPVATWLSANVIGSIGVPAVVSNVLTMAIVGVLICTICKVLPWVKKKPIPPHRTTPKPEEDVYRASWLVRRCLADFTEAQFYGNEVASVFLLAGIVIDWFLMPGVTAYGDGANVLPAIILSQFVGTAVGVFLYINKFEKGGWYATYVPVVSVGPACVLLFGGSIPVALMAGGLGGVIGAPLAEFFNTFLPEDVAGTNANVASMVVCTIIVAMTMTFLGF